MNRIHYLQHVDFEDLGAIETWATQKGYRLTSTRFYENDLLPGLADFDWLVIMGGPMGVYDEDTIPWLAKEKEFIRNAIKAGKTILGICLGSQLLAEALGSNVYPNKQKEIGWFPIQKIMTTESTLFDFMPSSPTVFHWHGDTFDLPKEAVLLASTAICPNQAFVYGDKIVGLQFHLEVTDTSVKRMIEHGRAELKPMDFIQTEAEIVGATSHLGENQTLLTTLLDKMAVLT